MPKLKRPTLKMKKFARAYVKNGGNGTRAALESYNTTKIANAERLAVQALDHPLVQEEISKLLDKAGLSLESLSNRANTVLDNALDAKPSFTAGVSLLQFLFKLHGVTPVNKSVSAKWSIKQNIGSKDVGQLINELKTLQSNVDRLLTRSLK